MDKSLVEPNDFFQSFAIIYREKGRVREVKEGVIFIEESNSINDKEIYYFVCDLSELEQILGKEV